MPAAPKSGVSGVLVSNSPSEILSFSLWRLIPSAPAYRIPVGCQVLQGTQTLPHGALSWGKVMISQETEFPSMLGSIHFFVRSFTHLFIHSGCVS